MEFGQKVGRRVGATVALGVTTLGIGALPVLFSKKKKHYLTVEFAEGGSTGVAVFELAKGIVRPMLATLEARTGKRVMMEGAAEGSSNEPQSTAETVAAVVPVAAKPVAAAPPKPQPPAATTLSITSVPSGADIYLDGQFAGSAPRTLTLNPGEHKIEGRFAGHRNQVQAVNVSEGSASEVKLTLEVDPSKPRIVGLQ